jgi:hypothetical protein
LAFLTAINSNEDCRALFGDHNYEVISRSTLSFSNSSASIDGRKDPPAIPESPPDPHYVIEEAQLNPESFGFAVNNPSVEDLSDFEEMKVLSSSRFGIVRLFRRADQSGRFEWFTGKFYNPV